MHHVRLMRLVLIRLFMPALLLVLAPARLSANMRAPFQEAHPASFAIDANGVTNPPTVLGEDLRFRCGPTACEVAATYRIHLEAPRLIQTSFILPAQETITVRHGGKAFSVAAKPAPEIPWPEHPLWNHPDTPLHKATFEVELGAGENTISIEYVQPLGVQERGYSYFRDGKRVRVWSYELWPLAEWRRAPGMVIRVSADVPRKPPSRWKRWFDNHDEMECRFVAEKGGERRSRVLHETAKQVADRYVREIVISAEPVLSERMLCEWGSADLLYSYKLEPSR
jgi:hypothetical protein